MAPGHKRLLNNPRLEVRGELPPPPSPANHFQPMDRRHLRLKLMVKRRHKPISHSEIDTIADHGAQKKVGSKQRLRCLANNAQFTKRTQSWGADRMTPLTRRVPGHVDVKAEPRGSASSTKHRGACYRARCFPLRCNALNPINRAVNVRGADVVSTVNFPFFNLKKDFRRTLSLRLKCIKYCNNIAHLSQSDRQNLFDSPGCR